MSDFVPFSQSTSITLTTTADTDAYVVPATANLGAIGVAVILTNIGAATVKANVRWYHAGTSSNRAIRFEHVLVVGAHEDVDLWSLKLDKNDKIMIKADVANLLQATVTVAEIYR